MSFVRPGPIPAPAGEPSAATGTRTLSGAYPRACGGAGSGKSTALRYLGLSPRLRGSRPAHPAPAPVPGPIPAPAGEPARACPRPSSSWAYPRACGGAIADLRAELAATGLSPRLRGSPSRALATTRARGPIPAPAGEPYRRRAATGSTRAYPRACGGAGRLRRLRALEQGLSPRLRGSLPGDMQRHVGPRPIPAPAGEPPPSSGRPPMPRAYPRACGGADKHARKRVQTLGLSPRLRGSRCEPDLASGAAGPIPAPAGEPTTPASSTKATMAYPRACGGARSHHAASIQGEGLSPRLRGSLS